MRAIIGIVLFICACGARTGLGAPSSGETSSDSGSGAGTCAHPAIWPMLGHDLGRTAQSAFDGPRTPNVKWTVMVQAFPVIANDGTLYVTGDLSAPISNGLPWGHVQSFDADGTFRWGSPDIAAVSPPALGCDGTIYVLGTKSFVGGGIPFSAHIELFAISPDGGVVSTVDSGLPYYGSQLSFNDSPRPIDGRVLVGASGGVLLSFVSGALEWNIPTDDGFISATPSGEAFADVGSDETFSSVAPSGSVVWTTPFKPRIPNLIAPDGTIFVGTSDGVYALTSGGALQFHVPMPSVTAMALAPNGTLYVSSGGDLVAVVLATHASRVVRKGSDVSDTLVIVIDASSVVYVLDPAAGALYALNPDDSPLFGLQAMTSLFADDLALGDHVLYVNTPNGLAAVGP